MYEITFCRIGKYYTPNKKGCFKKDFYTLDEIVKYFVTSRNKLYAPNLLDELSKKEIMILSRKLDSQLMIK